MKEATKTLYTCDYCNKRLLVKSAMVNHEIQCSKNPANVLACSDCVHLEEVPKEIGDYYGDQFRSRTAKGFHCNKKNQGVYHPKVVWRGLLDRYPQSFEDEIVMPFQCDQRKEFLDDILPIFNP